MQHSVKWLSNIWIDGYIMAIYIYIYIYVDIDIGIYRYIQIQIDAGHLFHTYLKVQWKLVIFKISHTRVQCRFYFTPLKRLLQFYLKQYFRDIQHLSFGTFFTPNSPLCNQIRIIPYTLQNCEILLLGRKTILLY